MGKVGRGIEERCGDSGEIVSKDIRQTEECGGERKQRRERKEEWSLKNVYDLGYSLKQVWGKR